MRRKTGKRNLKENRISEYLLDTLLPLPHGAKLPSLREIMAKTGAGQQVVSRVLRDLQSDGLIRIEPRSGIRRVESAQHPDEIRLLHWQNLADNLSFVRRIFRRLSAHAEAAGKTIVVEGIRNRLPDELVEELISQGISQCILYGADIADWAIRLKPRMKLCMEMFPKHSMHVTTELKNSPDMTVMQMDYLLKRGYRRIGYLHCYGDDPYAYPLQAQRLMDFYRIMAESGLRVDPAWVFRCSEHYDDMDSGMDRIMNAEPPPEALILQGANCGLVYTYCRKHGIRIGEDLALFCCDDLNENLEPEPTTITNNPEAIAETCWKMLAAVLRGEKVESRTTELMIRVGQTVPIRKER